MQHLRRGGAMATPKTPASAITSYLTPAEFLKRTDQRTIGQLCSDTEGVPVSPTNLLTDPNLQAALDDAAGDVESAIFIGNKYTTLDLAVLIGLATSSTNLTAALGTLVFTVTMTQGAFVPNQQLKITSGTCVMLATIVSIQSSTLTVNVTFLTNPTTSALWALSGYCAATAKLYRIIRDRALAYLVERRPNLSEQLPAGVTQSMDRSEAWLEQLAQGVRIFGFIETAAAGVMDQNILQPQDVVFRNGLVVQAQRYFGIRADRNFPQGWTTGATQTPLTPPNTQ